MRILEIVSFFVALTALIAALVTAGTALGDIFWRAGIAVLLVDIVMMMIWPRSQSPAA